MKSKDAAKIFDRVKREKEQATKEENRKIAAEYKESKKKEKVGLDRIRNLLSAANKTLADLRRVPDFRKWLDEQERLRGKSGVPVWRVVKVYDTHCPAIGDYAVGRNSFSLVIKAGRYRVVSDEFGFNAWWPALSPEDNMIRSILSLKEQIRALIEEEISHLSSPENLARRQLELEMGIHGVPFVTLDERKRS